MENYTSEIISLLLGNCPGMWLITRYYIPEAVGFSGFKVPQNKMTLSQTKGNLMRFQTIYRFARIRHLKHLLMFYQRMPISSRPIFANGAGRGNSQSNKFGMPASFFNNSLHSISQKTCQTMCFEIMSQHASSAVCKATFQIICRPMLWNMHVIDLSI